MMCSIIPNPSFILSYSTATGQVKATSDLKYELTSTFDFVVMAFDGQDSVNETFRITLDSKSNLPYLFCIKRNYIPILN